MISTFPLPANVLKSLFVSPRLDHCAEDSGSCRSMEELLEKEIGDRDLRPRRLEPVGGAAGRQWEGMTRKYHTEEEVGQRGQKSG